MLSRSFNKLHMQAASDQLPPSFHSREVSVQDAEGTDKKPLPPTWKVVQGLISKFFILRYFPDLWVFLDLSAALNRV